MNSSPLLSVVILAAGQGTRMRSSIPKVLHPLAGKPMISHVLETAQQVSQDIYVIYGDKGEQLKEALSTSVCHWVSQNSQQGTAHAVLQALPHLPKQGRVLILYGDIPLISAQTIKDFIVKIPEEALGILTLHLDKPAGFGRIIRDGQGKIQKIVEDKDASAQEKAVQEINTGIYIAPVSKLSAWLPQISNANAQQEYYLTDIVALAVNESTEIVTQAPATPEEVLGVNDKIQLAQLERYYQHRQAQTLMQNGVTVIDPQRLDIRGTLDVGQDVILDINVIIEGHVVIGDRCCIGPHVILRDVVINDDVNIHSHCVIEGATIANQCSIGPFARIRPNTQLDESVRIGNFVEIKNSKCGQGAKVNHLAYMGDAIVGQAVNVGAGAITCNYDGANKHQTRIGDYAFIGSNATLIAPVSIGEYATIGAQSVITQDAPAQKLTLSRSVQRTVDGWVPPSKIEKE